jgi:hypothetical protein
MSMGGYIQGMDLAGGLKLSPIILEGMFSEPVESHALQESSRDDAVSIYVIAVDGYGWGFDHDTLHFIHEAPIIEEFGTWDRSAMVRKIHTPTVRALAGLGKPG